MSPLVLRTVIDPTIGDNMFGRGGFAFPVDRVSSQLSRRSRGLCSAVAAAPLAEVAMEFGRFEVSRRMFNNGLLHTICTYINVIVMGIRSYQTCVPRLI